VADFIEDVKSILRDFIKTIEITTAQVYRLSRDVNELTAEVDGLKTRVWELEKEKN
jgi:hypothetical protein